MLPLHALLPLLLLTFTTLVSSASKPTSFCKCVCGANSTIIPLDAPLSSSSLHSTRSLSPLNPLLQSHVQDVRVREEEPQDGEEEKGEGEGGKDEEKDKGEHSRRKTCNDCNKQYCLNQKLHICEEVKEGDVWATCFQRDSRKDEAVVFIFIFATAGLLGWAAVKPWVGRWISNARERNAYLPVGGEEERDT